MINYIHRTFDLQNLYLAVLVSSNQYVLKEYIYIYIYIYSLHISLYKPPPQKKKNFKNFFFSDSYINLG